MQTPFRIRYVDWFDARPCRRCIGKPSIWFGDRLFMYPDGDAQKIVRKLNEAFLLGRSAAEPQTPETKT